MGKRPGQAELPVIPIGETTTKFVAPDSAFWSVHNFLPTDEGGFISIHGPLPTIQAEGGGNPSSSPSTATANPLTYGPTYGVFHARLLGGSRDVLLLHTADQIWELQGWNQQWGVLVGPSTSNPLYEDDIPTPTLSDYRTQFVATPTGVVIVPSHGRSYFYDGTVVLPLGYDKTPGPPTGLGPENSAGSWFPDPTQGLLGINDQGYSVDAAWSVEAAFVAKATALNPYFRYGRLGTITTPGNLNTITEDDQSVVMGYLEPGRWRARVQWIDLWGNLSPLSPPSNDVKFSRQPSVTMQLGPPFVLQWCSADLARKQVAWDGVSGGPDGTIGRNIFRTKDLENSGDSAFYELPRDAAVNVQAFATLPDNFTRFYPDNIPDGWLVNQAIDIAPVPMFRLACMSFGRLFIGNLRGDPGALMWSMPGRWGTFERVAKMYPDPSAAAITGMFRVDGGLLVFTETGMFMITPNAEGDGFRSATVSATTGCIAPQSIATLRNGVTVWLGRDGFYAYSGGEPSFIFDMHRYHAKRFNRATYHRSVAVFDSRSGQYRCWVPYESGQSADLCFCYDGTAWHTRDDTKATGATVTADHRKLLIVSGSFGDDSGVWVVDQGGEVQPAEIVTAWLRNMRSKDRSSIRFVWLWLRETQVKPGAERIQVDVYRDYRAEVESTSHVLAYPKEHPTNGPANPSVWDTDVFGTDAQWRHRRPYWVRVDIDVPTCEVFRLKISCTNEIEILAISFDEMPRDSAGASAFGV